MKKWSSLFKKNVCIYKNSTIKKFLIIFGVLFCIANMCHLLEAVKLTLHGSGDINAFHLSPPHSCPSLPGFRPSILPATPPPVHPGTPATPPPVHTGTPVFSPLRYGVRYQISQVSFTPRFN